MVTISSIYLILFTRTIIYHTYNTRTVEKALTERRTTLPQGNHTTDDTILERTTSPPVRNKQLTRPQNALAKFFVFKANGRAPSRECNARQTFHTIYRLKGDAQARQTSRGNEPRPQSKHFNQKLLQKLLTQTILTYEKTRVWTLEAQEL